MNTPLDDTCLARIPLAALPLLGGQRARGDVHVSVNEEHAWVQWPAGDEEVLSAILPIAGGVLYRRGEEHWFRVASRLPAREVPQLAGRLLHDVLLPLPVQPTEPPAEPFEPIRLRIVPSAVPRPTSAIRIPASQLGDWAENQPHGRLKQLRATRLGDQVLLLGSRLPALPDAIRYWGSTLLVPLGFEPVPTFAPALLQQALGVKENELVVLSEEEAEVIPLDRFAPLSLSSIRLALRPEGAWTP